MILQVHIFSRRKSFARTGIWTLDPLTRTFLPIPSFRGCNLTLLVASAMKVILAVTKSIDLHLQFHKNHIKIMGEWIKFPS